MRLNWFSPLRPAKTEIARYTSELLPDVCALADVTLWTTQAKWDPCPAQAPIQRYRVDRIPWLQINAADISIFHMGNNPEFHADIWQVARRQPGMVVLHDTSLHHFFDGIYRRSLRDPDRYVEAMRRYYGHEGAQAALRNLASKGRETDRMAVTYPLTAHALEDARAVLVHTEQAREFLRTVLSVPVRYVPLPFSPREPANVAAASSWQAPPPYRLVLFGYLGSNRRVAVILDALAAMPEREKLSLDIYGMLGDESKIRKQIKSLGLRNVSIHGFVSDHELERALSSAHMAINLRNPTMGEASASQLRIWSHALPSLVSEVGWYASLPRDTVRMVRTGEHEIADIQRHLRDFLEHPDEFKRMGEKGLTRLHAVHSSKACARAIVELAAQIS